MATPFHAHGPCYAQTNTGASNAMETLGMTEDGARVRINEKKRPVRTDAAGPEVPADLQMMGEDADIEFTLAAWDAAVLVKVLNKSHAAGTSGQGGAPGALIGTGGYSFGLYLPSSTDDPWYFPCCTLKNPHEIKEGTEYGRLRLSVYAWRFVPASTYTAAAIPLYTRAAPP